MSTGPRPSLDKPNIFFKKTAATRGHHKSPDSTPGWPSRPLQKSQAARRYANPNEPRQHLRYAASHQALGTTNNKRCPSGKPNLLFCCCHNCAYKPGDVNNPTPTALGQPAAFLSCTRTPETSNVGSDTQREGHVSADVRRYNAHDRQRIKRSQDAGTSPSRYTIGSVRRHQSTFCMPLLHPPFAESESRHTSNTACALQSAALAAIPIGSAPGLAIVNAESPEKPVLKGGVPLVSTGLPTTIMADDTPTEMDFTESQGNDDAASHPEGSWTTVSANRKPASTARPRT
ncbi:hypothetical protein MTO96_019236 [Rhipicephalus appendiculatus]